MKSRPLMCVLLSLSLIGCAARPAHYPTAMTQMQATLANSIHADKTVAQRTTRIPVAVNQALIPAVNTQIPGARQAIDHRFNIAVNNVPAKQFFLGLVNGTPYNIVVSPQVTGKISIHLQNVTVKEVLNAVRDTYGYDYQVMPYGYEVLPRGLRSRIFSVNYLNIERSGLTQTKVNGGQPTSAGNSTHTTSTGGTLLGNSSSMADNQATSEIETKIKTNFWKTLTKTLTTIVGNASGRSVVVDPQAGIVVVKAYPSELREVSHYLNTIQHNVDRQVIIDAKILEVNLNNGYQQGINWNVLGFSQQGDTFRNNNLLTGTDNILKRLDNNVMQLHISSGDFSAIIKLLSTEGNVQVLSSPRISTVNNQKAVIKVGTDEYFVTGVSSLTLGSTGTNDTSQDINLTPFFSGIALDVTPQIDRRGDVILHIHPSVSKVVDQKKVIQLGQDTFDLPLALSSIRESDSVVRARSGQVVVIGGLMENSTQEQIAGTPWVSKLPLIGGLFRDIGQTSKRSELVILLKPVVVNRHTWGQQLRSDATRFNAMNRGFHFGGHPAVFGTMAEKLPPQ